MQANTRAPTRPRANSQVEYLWVPGCFVQPDGPQKMELFNGRIVTIVPVRLNASGKVFTVQVLAIRC